jgi:hypothetical protein
MHHNCRFTVKFFFRFIHVSATTCSVQTSERGEKIINFVNDFRSFVIYAIRERSGKEIFIHIEKMNEIYESMRNFVDMLWGNGLKEFLKHYFLLYYSLLIE